MTKEQVARINELARKKDRWVDRGRIEGTGRAARGVFEGFPRGL